VDRDDLLALVEADRWIERVVHQRDHLPEAQHLSEIEATLRAMVTSLKEVEAELAPLEAGFSEAEGEAGRLRQRLAQVSARLNADGTAAKDLAVLQREVDHIKEILSHAEDREVETLLAVEPVREIVANIREGARPLMSERAELIEAVKALQASLDEEIVALRATRAQTAVTVRPELLRLYEAALSHAGGAGAAVLEGGRCTGCRLTLAPLDIDRAKQQPEGSFLECPSCGRLLLP
jgi:hypothetical protein